jgi:hypothetical protein
MHFPVSGYHYSAHINLFGFARLRARKDSGSGFDLQG